MVFKMLSSALLDQDGIICIIGGYDANSRMLMIKYVFSFIVTKEL